MHGQLSMATLTVTSFTGLMGSVRKLDHFKELDKNYVFIIISQRSFLITHQSFHPSLKGIFSGLYMLSCLVLITVCHMTANSQVM